MKIFDFLHVLRELPLFFYFVSQFGIRSNASWWGVDESWPVYQTRVSRGRCVVVSFFHRDRCWIGKSFRVSWCSVDVLFDRRVYRSVVTAVSVWHSARRLSWRLAKLYQCKLTENRVDWRLPVFTLRCVTRLAWFNDRSIMEVLSVLPGKFAETTSDSLDLPFDCSVRLYCAAPICKHIVLQIWWQVFIDVTVG